MLSVDRELNAGASARSLRVIVGNVSGENNGDDVSDGNNNNAYLHVTLAARDWRLLRTVTSSFFDFLYVVVETVVEFGESREATETRVTRE